ncbi:hypothetical protein RSAG8_05775, partial [Rhizoctonia solani AG-8 WAC10335]
MIKDENGKTVPSQKSIWVSQHAKQLSRDATPVLRATPRFYVIPKIHKSPWKGRPIVPAHSAVHSPAAKLASMMLKPLVNRQPYVIRGSKEFIRDISAIRFYREEKSKIFIVGGDIEAYYPNVPKGKASQIVKEMMEEDPRQSEENFGSFFEECLDVADSTVVMRFQDDWYVQTDGLSMGVAHAPDMANLYGSYYENQIIPTLGSDILYYGRYIDDVFFVVRANNAEAAEDLCKQLVIDGVNIVWEPAKAYGVFLDDRQVGERPPPRDVQVLRSVFNQVWEFVDISVIQDSIREQWDKDLTFARLGGLAAIPPNMNKPLLVARKGTMNLGDLVTRMRKIVLDYNNVSEDLGREVTDFWKS